MQMTTPWLERYFGWISLSLAFGFGCYQTNTDDAFYGVMGLMYLAMFLMKEL